MEAVIRGGDDSNNHNRRFIQPLLPHFLNSFSIPTSFLKHLEPDLKGVHLETVVLMSDHHPHRHWLVSVESRRFFGFGWKDFCLHLHLRIGDFLLFTYLSHFLFHVSVFDPASACLRTFPFISNTPLTLPQHITKHDPTQFLSCRLHLTSYSIHKSIIYLPAQFARQSQLVGRKCQVKMVDEEERTWKVGLSSKRNKSNSYICQGWRDFQKANCFKRGDVLCLQLLQAGEQPILKCYRSNNTGEESNANYKTIPKKALLAGGDTTTTSSSEQYLSCHVHLSSYSVNKLIIFLPTHFVRESRIKSASRQAKVVDEQGRTWDVSLGFGKSKAKAYICRGWRDVQNANCFKMGDVLCFQLLQAGEYPILRCYRDKQEKENKT